MYSQTKISNWTNPEELGSLICWLLTVPADRKSMMQLCRFDSTCKGPPSCTAEFSSSPYRGRDIQKSLAPMSAVAAENRAGLQRRNIPQLAMQQDLPCRGVSNAHACFFKAADTIEVGAFVVHSSRPQTLATFTTMCRCASFPLRDSSSHPR